MKFCPNPKCQAPVIYQGTSCINGAFVEWHLCLDCKEMHKVEAESAAPLTGDDDTQELPRVIVETGAQS